MKRSLREIGEVGTPTISEEALQDFAAKDEKQYNTRNDDATIFEVICRNKENFEKIIIDGKSIGKYIADM